MTVVGQGCPTWGGRHTNSVTGQGSRLSAIRAGAQLTALGVILHVQLRVDTVEEGVSLGELSEDETIKGTYPTTSALDDLLVCLVLTLYYAVSWRRDEKSGLLIATHHKHWFICGHT